MKVSQAVTEWEEKKRQQKKKAREMILEEERKKNRKEKVKDEKQMKITAAVIAWETEKNELAKMRREKKRQERETKKEEERKRCLKKEESEMVSLFAFLVGREKSCMSVGRGGALRVSGSGRSLVYQQVNNESCVSIGQEKVFMSVSQGEVS